MLNCNFGFLFPFLCCAVFAESLVIPHAHAGDPTSRPIAEVQTFDYARKEIYHSPERPGYTSWVGLWLAQDGRLQCSFTQITGPKDKPVSTVVVLESRDEGQAWTRVQGDIPLGGGRGMVVLKDGALVRPQWPDGADGTGCVRRSSDGGKTWSDRVELMPAAAYRVWPTVIRPLRDGRLVLNAGVWKRGDGDVPNPRMTKMVFVSSDEGRSWGKPIVLVPTEKGVCEESDSCELASGDLFCIHRAEHFPQQVEQIPPGAARMGEPFPTGYSDRLQSVVRKKGNAWEPDPPASAPFAHSGFPDVLLTQEGVILHLATDGISWTADVGKTWQQLPLDGTGYYPRSVQLPGGKIVCIGHVGSDDVYGTVDQWIVQQTFRLKVAAEQ